MKSLTLPEPKLRHLLSLADGATFVDRVPCKKQPELSGEIHGKPAYIYETKHSEAGYVHTNIEAVERFMQLDAPHAPGDVLFVKESLYVDVFDYSVGRGLPKSEPTDFPWEYLYYRADGDCCQQIPECCCAEVGKPKWHKASQMPEWAARLFVRVVSVRPERVMDVTEEDARLEGFSPEYDRSNDDAHKSHLMAMEQFWYAWDARNPKHQFDSNPWVWRCEFTKTTGGES